MDLLKGELGSSGKMCVTSTLNGNQVTCIEDERITCIKEEEDQESMKIPEIKMEPKNCFGFVEGETCSYSETCVMLVELKKSILKLKKAIDMKDEIPEAITFALIKTELEHDKCYIYSKLLHEDE